MPWYVFFFCRINIVLQVLLSVSLHRPQIIYHAHGINVCMILWSLWSTRYILSKTTAAASSSPLLSRRTKSASGPDHPHFATVRVVSSSVASLSLSPAEFLLMNSNRKNSTAVQSSESKSEKKYFEVLPVLRVYFVQQSNQKSSTTAVPYDTEFRIQIRKIVRYEVWYLVQQYGTRVQRDKNA